MSISSTVRLWVQIKTNLMNSRNSPLLGRNSQEHSLLRLIYKSSWWLCRSRKKRNPRRLFLRPSRNLLGRCNSCLSMFYRTEFDIDFYYSWCSWQSSTWVHLLQTELSLQKRSFDLIQITVLMIIFWRNHFQLCSLYLFYQKAEV